MSKVKKLFAGSVELRMAKNKAVRYFYTQPVYF